MFKITDEIKILLPTGSVRFSGFCSRGLYVPERQTRPCGSWTVALSGTAWRKQKRWKINRPPGEEDFYFWIVRTKGENDQSFVG